MPLNWNVSQCADWEELVCESKPSAMGGSVYVDGSTDAQRNEDRITTHLVFMTMAVEMNQITEENFEEFYRRAAMAEETGDACVRLCVRTGDGEDDFDFPSVPVTLEMVKRRIGLSTNAVGKELSAKAFDAKMAKHAEK